MKTISRNHVETRKRELPAFREVIFAKQEPDIFTYQEHGKRFAKSITAGTEKMDTVDFITGLQGAHTLAMQLAIDVANHSKNSQYEERLNNLRTATIQHLVHAMDWRSFILDGSVDYVDVYNTIFGTPQEEWDNIDNGTTIATANSRMELYNLMGEGKLFTKRDATGYAKPITEKNRERLTSKAADTIERLHLLKAYGITPFEITGESIDFPWDIAVIPPIDSSIKNKNLDLEVHAPGAVADFILLERGQERTHTLLSKTEVDDRTTITIGDTDALMRLRLHDDGGIAHGMYYHNINSDLTERTFAEASCHDAFQRIRGIIIAAAFDATVPEEIINGRHIRGGISHNMQENQRDSLDKRITEALLRRAKTMRIAGVTEQTRRASEWPAPQSPVSGYIRKLPEGARARPEALKEAREYYTKRGIKFDGLPEGSTFTKPYTRNAESERLPYRRARFRKTAETTVFLQQFL